MNPKIKTYSFIALSSASCLPLGCSNSIGDDPNIENSNPNLTLNAVQTSPGVYSNVDEIDIDGDGEFDFYIYLAKVTTVGDTENYWGAFGLNSVNKLLTETHPAFPDPNGGLLKSLNNKLIGNSSSIWTRYGVGAAFTGYPNDEDPAYDIGNIKSGSGDKYIGFRFKINSNTHYGWARVNYSSDALTLKIIETAYNKTPNEEIKSGDR